MKNVLTLVILLLSPWAIASEKTQLNLAVIQFASVDGDVFANLNTASYWLKKSVAGGAEFILFPEFMPTGYQLSEAIWENAETMDGLTVSWLKEKSLEYGVWLGTSFLEVEGEHFYNSFVLTNTQGKVSGKVRKEVPASSEAYFFKGEESDHFIDTEIGRIGVMICYESYLSRIANKVAMADIDLLLLPYSFPEVLGGEIQPLSGVEYATVHARSLGVPVAAANKVGDWKSPIPEFPSYQALGHFPGLSAISNADGEIESQLNDQPGFAVATVSLESSQKRPPRLYEGRFVSELVAKNNPQSEIATINSVGVEHYLNNRERSNTALRMK